MNIDNTFYKYLMNEAKIVDEIGKFWVVTKSQVSDELNDIFFETDIFSFALQIKGGLDEKDIIGVYKNKNKAKSVAEKSLK